MARGTGHRLTFSAIERICSHLVDGMGLRKALAAENWKSPSAFYAYLRGSEKAREAYKQAIQMRAELWAEELVDIADDGSRDTRIEEHNGKQVKVVDHDHIRRSVLRVDTRKWIISKHLPKTYGDKTQVDHNIKGEVEHKHTLCPRSEEIFAKLAGGSNDPA